MLRWVDTVERWVKVGLVVLMLLVIVLASLDLVVSLAKEMAQPPYVLLDMGKFLHMLGYFFLVLIGLELLETVKGYFKDHAVHADGVLLVALTALARKVIILEYDKVDVWHLLGLAGMILSLSLGYYLCKRGGRVEGAGLLSECGWRSPKQNP